MEGSEDYTDCTLFVGDLSRDVSKDDLYNLFEMVGIVQEAVVKCSNVTGQPMGYGFVRMATRDDAEHALQALAGMNLKGRCIRVGRAERNCRLIVKNLDRSVRFEDLLHIFLPYGSLQMYDSGQEVSVNGFCARILHFVRRADAERAKRDLHMQTFHGRPMHVEWYRHTPEDAIGGEPGNSRNEPVVSVHVRFMAIEADLKVDEHLLYHVFKKYGEVTKISIKALIQDKETNLCRGYAFVHFTPNLIGCQSALEAAAAMDDVMYNGVHFFSKPSQNFHRAHEELLRQDNQQQQQQQQQHHHQHHQHQQQQHQQKHQYHQGNSYSQASSSTRRYPPDQTSAGRVVRPPAPQLNPSPRVRNSQQGYPAIPNSASASVSSVAAPGVRGIPNISTYNPTRYYDETIPASYPRIMQYQQHEQPEYLARLPFSYPAEYVESDPLSRGLLWSNTGLGYGPGYPRPYDYNNQEDPLFGSNEAMKFPDGTQRRVQRENNIYNLYAPSTPAAAAAAAEISRSTLSNPYPYPQNQSQNQIHQIQMQNQIQQPKIYSSLTNGHAYPQPPPSSSHSLHPPPPPLYASKEIFPQEYYDSNLNNSAQVDPSQASNLVQYPPSLPAESGLNIEASAFLPANVNRTSRMMQSQNIPENPDPYNLVTMDRNIPRHTAPSPTTASVPSAQDSLDNSRAPYVVVSSETEIPQNLDINDQTNVDNSGPDTLSDLIDRSLPSDTELHHHAIMLTETHEY